jgi:hypothetical protein
MIVDAYNMPFGDNRIPGIVSIEVLDALFNSRTVVEEIHRVLSPGSPMVAFFDMLPSHEITMEIFPDDVLFPRIRRLPGTAKLDGRSDYLKVDREELSKGIERHQSMLSAADLASLHSYMDEPARRYTGIFSMRGPETVEVIEKLSSMLRLLQVKHDIINGVESYTEYLKKLLKEMGFRIEEAGFRTAAVILSRTDMPGFDPDCNCLEYNMGFSTVKKDPGLSAGDIKIQSTIYVIAARK